MRYSIKSVNSVYSEYSVSDSVYADKFRFTESELVKILNDAELADRKNEFKEWYDGYNFGNGT